MKIKISSAAPSIEKSDIDIVNKAMKIGWGNKKDIFINRFESKFSSYLKKKYCITVSHCTDAIHLALLAIGIKEGDEVIVPDFTWVASAAPIKYLRAKPVFIDVRKDSWCINEELIEKKISKRTKAIIVVDLLGNMPNWNKIIKIAKKNKIKIIEDAAESIGAKYKNKLAGSFGDISLFSLNATKLIMSGQGGIFCTNNLEYYKKAKLLKNHGIDQEKTGKYYWSTILGYNYNWTNFQAALAISQFNKINKLLNYKKWLYNEYKKNLTKKNYYKLNEYLPDVSQSYWITCLIIDPKLKITKEDLIKKIRKYQIDLRPIFYPLSSMPTFYTRKAKYKKINKNSYELSKYGVCLPSGNNLNENNIKYICEKIHIVITKHINK